MNSVLALTSRKLRYGALTLAATIAVLTVASGDADARSRHRHHGAKRHHAEVQRPRAQARSENSRYAAIVLDAKSGSVLHEESPDALRHPASLTKMMTLYLLFEKLDSGKVSLNTEMEVSREAAAQAPTKLGLRPGQTLEVEDAIKGLVTKSANDAAVVIGEYLGGSHAEFARMMTRKAQALGMSRTIYRNANGLPNDEQVTTARDQALLGIALYERFPQYYHYFSTPSFTYHGQTIRNHNHLLGSVAGVDGIKTGYTLASGFNLVTSVRRNGRHIVGVVLGGRSVGARDARMRTLIEGTIMEASVGRPNVKFAQAAEAPGAPLPLTPPAAAKSTLAYFAPPEAAPQRSAPRSGSTEPIKPVAVKTVMVKLASAKSVPAKLSPRAVEAKADSNPAPIRTASLEPVAVPAAAAAKAPAARSGILGVLPAAVAAAGSAMVPAASAAEVPRGGDLPRHTAHGGWGIQIGAFEAEQDAKARLNAAKSKATGLLGKADPYTERTTKGVKTYYRARFAGLGRDEAEAACKTLKRNEIACMALKI
jgi:D-alanyl-D-alanine carboxypeptidase